MPKTKRPKDTNQLAKLITDIATGNTKTKKKKLIKKKK